MSRQTINAIEKEKFDPGLLIAFRIAKVFDMKIEEIFSMKDGRPLADAAARRRGLRLS